MQRKVAGSIHSKVRLVVHTWRMSMIKRFLKDESGATAIEYGLIAAGIAIAIIAAVQGVGTKLKTNFGTISTSLK
jgi:pilus assembly protein Flp/PilA